MSQFRSIAKDHLAQLDSLIERGSVPALRKLYEQAVSELETKLAGMVDRGAGPFSVQQARSMLAQAKAGLVRTSINMGAALNEQSVRAQQLSVKQLISSVKKMEKETTGAAIRLPIEQASRLGGVLDKRKSSLLKLNQSSMAKYGATVVGKIEQAVAMSLLKGEAGYSVVNKVADVMGGEWWRAERIVRTETANVFNASHADAIADSAREFHDLMMRWTEYVTDVTLQPMDERVGDDSIALHGQLARPGGMFYMPPFPPRAGLKISPSLRGGSWSHPPNRPNDRSVLQPWRPGWGWGWELVGGQRVERR